MLLAGSFRSSSDPRLSGSQRRVDMLSGLMGRQPDLSHSGPQQEHIVGATSPLGIGGRTWAPGNAMSNGKMKYVGGPQSWGATQDDGYRIGNAAPSDNIPQQAPMSGLDWLHQRSPMVSMGRDLQAGRQKKPYDPYGQDTRADGDFSPVQMRHGGPVPGRGTGDKIRALLDPREFVMKPEAVKRIGVRKLEAMNDGEDALKMRQGGHVAKARYKQQGIGLDYGDFGPKDSGYLDQRYIHAQTDPLTGMPRNANQFDIDRKRRELLHSGDIEALAQFDNLNHATRSGDPRSLDAARNSFAQFRAARQYYAGKQQPQVPSIADRGPVVDVETETIQPAGVQGISAMLQQAGKQALNPPKPNPMSVPDETVIDQGTLFEGTPGGVRYNQLKPNVYGTGSAVFKPKYPVIK